ncbi:class I SAM-dependent DNA methyltransferase [candidate division KSB1 bacterium]
METSKNNHKLYNEFSWLWPIISPPEEYEDETRFFSKTIVENAKIPVKSMLHLGCGGGHNDCFFKEYFEITGVDISKGMLNLAKNLNPEIEYIQGDMRSIRLNKNFDAVVIMDSVNYMLDEADLNSSFNTAYTHLKPGGVLLTLQEITKEKFKQNETFTSVHSNYRAEITFIENHYDPDPDDSTYEVTLIYLIRKKGKLEIQTDVHIGGVFNNDTLFRLLNQTGFEVKQLKYNRPGFEKDAFIPLFVCSK